MHNDDRQLVKLCLGGCESAWQQLYSRIKKTISFIVNWKLWNFSPHQAEEVAQEALNGFFSALQSFDFNCSIETFTSIITKNHCISELRRQTAAKRASDRLAVSLSELECIPGPAECSEQRLVRAEECRLLEHAFEQIGEGPRTILELRYFEEYSYKQIAKRLNIPQGTVASRLKRSHARLREKMDECGHAG